MHDYTMNYEVNYARQEYHKELKSSNKFFSKESLRDAGYTDKQIRELKELMEGNDK